MDVSTSHFERTLQVTLKLRLQCACVYIFKSATDRTNNMFFLIFAVVFIANGGGAQLSEESCDASELKICVESTPRTPVGLPRTKQELDAHCLAYQTGMACMDAWIRRCLPTDGQKLVQQQIGGARALMRYLCTNNTALRRDFLKEPTCWAVVSPDWSRCVDELQLAVRDISERSHQIVYFNKNTELCCARDEFVSCVALAGRACSKAAGNLLRSMAWVLAQDVAACSAQPRVHCAAPVPPFAAPILIMLSGVLPYPLR
ncbi:uncharacterized protein [Maniola hyperantus]|uniref:uncharacterized protein isoform X1 n=2 Tax=Aphantopus hyperantus TaxID=2795564 RepID=UPI0015680A0F|nr:uncharacterized protein LOC117986601 [Maniola hyperantus]